MQRKILLLAATAVLIAVAFYVYNAQFASQSVLSQRTSITIHQAAKTLLYLPLYIAVDEGFFTDQGIEVRVVTAGGDSQAFAALASGQAQFAQGDPTFAAISHERGGPGIVIASVLDRVAFWGVTFDQSMSRFTDPEKFRGLTVVTFPRPNTAYVVQESLLAKAGLELGKDSFIMPTTFGTELGPLHAGKAQIAVTIEPNVSQAIEQGGHIVFSYPDAWGPFLLTGLMTTEEFAERNPELVRAVVGAYDKALKLLRSSPEIAVSVGKRNFPEVSGTVIQSAISRLTTENVFPEHATVSQESWHAALELRAQVGDLKSMNHDALVADEFVSTSARN